MIKRTDAANNWLMLDATRDTYNVATKDLYADLSQAETSATLLDFTSNGFKIRNTYAMFNASGGTYSYMAFASMPTKFCASMAR